MSESRTIFSTRALAGMAPGRRGHGRGVDPAATGVGAVEVSVVIPCLNEAETVGVCVTKALRAMARAGICGEVVVADNGSTDDSPAIARRAGARVVPVAERGYGSALAAGIGQARGRYVVMGDADDSYDFTAVPAFVERLREGYHLVQGCRLPAGGGTVMPGAMPPLHRWLGNPLFSLLARWWFRAPIHDVYCGLRGFTAEFYHRLDLQCRGMEFATEMVLKAARFRGRIAEVPVTLHRDGRAGRAPHLRTFRDGWRTLRFFLLYSPKWLFLQPGKLLILVGLLAYALALPGLTVGGVRFGLHTLAFGSLAVLCGYQAIQFAVFAKTFAIGAGLMRRDRRLERFLRRLPLERGLLLGGVALAAGVALLGAAVVEWVGRGFGDLDYDRTMRWVVPGMTLTALGVQTVLASFFIGVLLMPRR